MTSQSIATRITHIEQVADHVCAYTLATLDATPLPGFEAGAHIDLVLNNGMIRQYSLCSDPGNTSHYQIAVLHEAAGRGGSAWIHQQLKTGDTLQINPPRNHFQLDENASNYVLIAGGIGITPIMLMAQRLQQLNKIFSLHYLSRTPEEAAFHQQLAQQFEGHIEFHHSYGDPSRRLNIPALFAGQPEGTQVYTCGSERLLQSILDAGEAHPEISVHFERFAAAPVADDVENSSFEVELASSGKVLEIQPDQSMLEVLRSEGYQIETMCEEGLCGSCEVALLDGEADHRDSVLTADEKAEQSVVMVCCSRAHSPRLKLDL